jgi:Xaa-Pro aminopeptidase
VSETSGLLTPAAFPTLSQGERQRRFTAVRAAMRARGIEALVLRSDSSKWDSGSAEGRYLTQIGGNGEEGYTIFGLHEDPTFIIWGAGHIDNWREIQDWTRDIRPSTPSAMQAVANRVEELGVASGVIGLVGRAPSPLAADGRWPWGAHEELSRRLPRARFVDFESDLAEVRSIKSSEEIVCHEKAMAIVEAAVGVLYAEARPGTRATDLMGKVVGALVSAGSEMCVSVVVGASRRAGMAARMMPHRPLETGDVILSEVTGKYAGYWSQAHVPVAVGQRATPMHQRLFDAALEGLRRGAAVLKPGVTTLDLASAIREPTFAAGFGSGILPPFKGIGLAITEIPLSPPVDADARGNYPVIREHMMLTLESIAYDHDAKSGVHLAETFAVTGDGCRRLGRRALDRLAP